jgi:hypothetical protein
MRLYTVEAFRFGNRTGGDSRITGVFHHHITALKAAADYEEASEGNYECEVIRWKLNKGISDPEMLTFPRAVIKGLPLFVYTNK